MDTTWTITELAAAAAAALSGEPVQVNGRVRDMPNERLIRWYTTIGLVDPPVARRGRVALYERRHLLQLIAVKRRQAAGLTIAQIQVELTGATDDTLQGIARLSGPTGSPGDHSPDPSPEDPSPKEPSPKEPSPEDPSSGDRNQAQSPRRRFWAPSPASPGDLAVVPASGAGTPARSRPAPGGESLPPVQGVRLAPGVTLLLDAGPLGPEDLAAIEIAARPLLDALRDRGLPGGTGIHPGIHTGVHTGVHAGTDTGTGTEVDVDTSTDTSTDTEVPPDPSAQFRTGRST